MMKYFEFSVEIFFEEKLILKVSIFKIFKSSYTRRLKTENG